mgnify:CR=1 FL=1
MDYILLVNQISNVRPRSITIGYEPGGAFVRLDDGPFLAATRDAVGELMIWLNEHDEYQRAGDSGDPREPEVTYKRRFRP